MNRALMSIVIASAAVCSPLVAHAQATARVGLFSPPACVVQNSLTAVAVQVGPNGGVITPENGNGFAGSVQIACNSLRSAVFIGSNPMETSAVINPSETGKFTKSIDFAAYARPRVLGLFGWQLASRPGVRGAWQSDYVQTPIMIIDVYATNFERLTKTPVAGTYRGQICITISPSGLPAPSRAQGTARCEGSGS